VKAVNSEFCNRQHNVPFADRTYSAILINNYFTFLYLVNFESMSHSEFTIASYFVMIDKNVLTAKVYYGVS